MIQGNIGTAQTRSYFKVLKEKLSKANDPWRLPFVEDLNDYERDAFVIRQLNRFKYRKDMLEPTAVARPVVQFEDEKTSKYRISEDKLRYVMFIFINCEFNINTLFKSFTIQQEKEQRAAALFYSV